MTRDDDTSKTSAAEVAAFLRARLQDDWNYARDAMTSSGCWTAERTVVVLDTGAEIADVFLGPADHIARFDPARVMTDVDAKRAIVDAYDHSPANAGAKVSSHEGLHTAVLLLASVYADHADYREEWRP
ncbi:DUF6221 family protein [Streptacidiphilus rugosus]|uniref:DUF6221 family protein n=1 Tax=Streptacidiphilus rugosus TaxID=405783 RepID=UPI00068CCA17|nr:DUF6221 family protein [Streptacidiphilus rugosus]